MYKKRLGDWKSSKYYTQDQKKKVISQLAYADLKDQSTAVIKLNGKPVQQQRLYRRVQRKGERFPIATKSNLAVRRAMKRYYQLHRTGQIQRLVLQQSKQSQNIEHFLRCTHRYYTWYNTQTEFQREYKYSKSHAEFCIYLENALFLLETDSISAFAMLNRSCAEVTSILKQQPFLFLPDFVDLIISTETRYIVANEIIQSLLKFTVSLSIDILGISHPITECMRAILSAEREFYLPLMTAFGQLYLDILQTMPKSLETARLSTDAVALLSSHGIKKDFIQHWLEEIELKATQKTLPTTAEREVISTYIYTRYFRQVFGMCEELCHKQIEWSTQVTGAPG